MQRISVTGSFESQLSAQSILYAKACEFECKTDVPMIVEIPAPDAVACLSRSAKLNWISNLEQRTGTYVSMPGLKKVPQVSSSTLPVYISGNFRALKLAQELIKDDFDA